MKNVKTAVCTLHIHERAHTRGSALVLLGEVISRVSVDATQTFSFSPPAFSFSQCREKREPFPGIKLSAFVFIFLPAVTRNPRPKGQALDVPC